MNGVKIGLITIGLMSLPLLALASTTDGTIDSTYKYAWSENIGWVNFGTAAGNVHITDSALTGYAWSENYGWINLNPSTSGVKNNGEGALSGQAWGENLGWINFSGVGIDYNGNFSGSASGTVSGRVSFDCANCQVKTDWRPACNNSVDDDSDGKIDYPNDPGCNSAGDGSEGSDVHSGGAGGSGGGFMPEVYPSFKAEPTITKLIAALPQALETILQFFKPELPPVKPSEISIKELIPKETPLTFRGKWQLLTYTLENLPFIKFTLAPLPKEFRALAQKFPTLKKTFEETGVARLIDVERLKPIKLTLPGLTESLRPYGPIGPEGQGVPVARLSPAIKKQLPSEIVFAKTGGQLIDFDIALSVTEKGKPQQKIATISGKSLQLAVKPDKPVKSVKGYVVFKSKASRPTSLELPLNSLLASLIFANPVFAHPQEKPVRVEEKLVLLEFEYTDPDADGIYTAEIQTPVIEGEYEIITVMDFEDLELGKKEIRLIVVVDPEGYLYEKDGDKETRIPGAIVSLFWLNPETKQYELWPAKEYQQENPQITDATGKYSFLVPEGSYYLKVEAPAYLIYDGKPFQVKEGSGIHINIELKTKYWWLKVVDWKIILLILFAFLLLYNFYRDKLRERQTIK